MTLRKRTLLQNTLLLTSTALLMRCIGMAFQAWLAQRIGAAGIGLYQLIMSVGMLAATFAISGIRFASTRLVAEELGAGQEDHVRAAMARCALYALCFGAAALALLFWLAEPVGFLWIGDARTVPSLRLFAFSLPFLALNSMFGGYFTAVGRVWKSSVVAVVTELVRIALIVFLLRAAPAGNITAACSAVTMGVTMGEMISCALLSLLFWQDCFVRHSRRRATHPMTRRMLRIALPLAFSAYARTSLSTAQHLLVPRQLRRSGLSADAALANYGIIHGMLFPLLTVPSCLLSALAEMLVPTLTAAQVCGKTGQICRLVRRMVLYTSLFAGAVFAFVFFRADWLCQVIYKDASMGGYLRILAFLIPLLYLDIIIDGCLKGLGQMLYHMGYCILDAMLSIVLVIFLLPRWAILGYIFMVFATEGFDLLLSALRLRKVLSMGKSS